LAWFLKASNFTRAIQHLVKFRPLKPNSAVKWYILAQTIFGFATAFPDTLMNFYLIGLGYDTVFIGVWHSASQIGALICLIPCLFLFDVMGRKFALVSGAALSILARLSTFYVVSPTLIIATEGMSGFGTILFSLASQSLLAELTDEKNRTKIFAVNDGFRGIFALTGGVLASILPTWLAQGHQPTSEIYRVVLISAFVLRLLGVIPLLFVTNLPFVSPVSVFSPKRLINKNFIVYLFVIPLVLIHTSNLMIAPFLNLYFRQAFGTSDIEIGFIALTRGLISGITVLMLAMFIKQQHEMKGFYLGIVGACTGILGLIFTQSLWVAVILLIVYAMCMSVIMPIYRARYISALDKSQYFLASWMMGFASGFAGPILGPPLSGYVQREFGFSKVFGMSAVLMLLAGTAYVMIKYVSSPKRSANKIL
jgi:MFS family permease